MIYKFQSLRAERDGESDQQRLTAWGKLLRKTSLDELPQLINIIRGEMNFVGPRPLLPEYLSRYTKRQNRRHEVKPGVTGWAQVKGRNALSWEEQLERDVWYVDHRGFWLDFKILALTFLKWFRASSEETGMRKAFDGKN